MTDSGLAQPLLIFVSTFVLEDVAVLGAALLVGNGSVSLPWAAGSSFAGIWLGDLGLYLLALHYGRPVFERSWFKRLIGKRVNLARSEAWFRDHGAAALVLSRIVPGTRLPTYLAAGLLKFPVRRFLSITAVAGLAWVALLFGFSHRIGKMITIAVLATGLGWSLRSVFRRIARWEFWPAAVFYIPVAVKYILLAVKYRSFSLPTLANPGMHTGGLIGESKFETIADLARAYPQFVAETHLVRFDSAEQQLARIFRLRNEQHLEYPLVFKPDVGQRGYGFKVIRSDEDVRSYVERFSRDILVQKYAPGPYEVGIFYYRLPGAEKGNIFAITEKVFPFITGDGQRTIGELIQHDPRASIVAATYLRRFADRKSRVLGAGESFKLVEAGNHCQGAIFLDGIHLLSGALERRIDAISQSVPGFFVGRYDIRYASDEALRIGQDFQIIELNGASSEATSIYDPANSLSNAYRTLFRQWEIIFAIGDENRKRGLSPTSLRTIWRSWALYQRRSTLCPVSD